MNWNFYDYAYAKWRQYFQRTGKKGNEQPYDHPDRKPKDTPAPKPVDDVKIGPG
jgi:hypothetical protein